MEMLNLEFEEVVVHSIEERVVQYSNNCNCNGGNCNCNCGSGNCNCNCNGGNCNCQCNCQCSG